MDILWPFIFLFVQKFYKFLDARNTNEIQIGTSVMCRRVIITVRSRRREKQTDKPALEISVAEPMQAPFAYLKADVIVLLAPNLTIGMY